MKKFIILAISILMLFSVVGCSNKNTNNETVDNQTAQNDNRVPELYIEGDRWPVDEEYLQESWKKLFPYLEDYFGPVADDFWEQGLTWLMNDATIAKGFNDQYPEKNLVEEGPMTAENIISNLSHETIHMWLQNNNDAIRFNEGQWIWEGVTNPTAMVIEHWDEIGEFFKYDKYGKGFDSFNFYGKEAVNGCAVDGDKANRRYSDYCAMFSFYYLTSILSTPGTYDFYAKWNALRNEKGDDNLTDHDEVCEIIRKSISPLNE